MASTAENNSIRRRPAPGTGTETTSAGDGVTSSGRVRGASARDESLHANRPTVAEETTGPEFEEILSKLHLMLAASQNNNHNDTAAGGYFTSPRVTRRLSGSVPNLERPPFARPNSETSQEEKKDQTTKEEDPDYDERKINETIKQTKLAKELLFKIQLKRLWTFEPDYNAVTGLTMLNDRIYVITALSNQIFVYDPVTYKALKPITIRSSSQHVAAEGALEVIDLVGSPLQGGSLYYHDRSNGGSIRRLWIKDRQTDLWLDQTIARGYFTSMSVLSTGHVMLLRDNPPTIDIYAADGSTLIKSIPLPPDVESPRHVIKLLSGNLLVSHGLAQNNVWGNQNRICEISPKGDEILREFGGVPGSDIDQLMGPEQLTVDEDERVYLADCGNDRVLVVDRKLLAARAVLGAQDREKAESLRSCARLFFDLDRKRLLVGLDSGKLHVINIVAPKSKK